jgi:glycosyltransferase involved in cell wall biosynthesis
VRVLALVATHNEERFIGHCIEHLAEQGVETYLIDNESTDATVEVAERHRGRGLADIEILPRNAVYALRRILDRKAELAGTLDADWFIHHDADEFRLPPRRDLTLASALAECDRDGYNAVDFQEFTFVPTEEEPDHDHPRFRETMRRYYPFLPASPNQLNAWRRQDGPVDLSSAAGHLVSFPGLRMCPEPFPMRHYQFLSVAHAIRKWVEREFDPRAVATGWHGARANLRAEDISLLPERELRRYESDDRLDPSSPRTEHPVFARARP